MEDRHLLFVIGDEDTVTGLLLAGIGHRDGLQRRNFLVVDHKTPVTLIQQTFEESVGRKDIAILLINQHIADLIRPQIDDYHTEFPALLEIPSKDHPYDPEKDSLMKRVQRLFHSE